MKTLTPTQLIILRKASERSDGNIEPLPDNINAGIKQRVIDGLLNRQLIHNIDNQYVINDAGYHRIGKPTPATIINKEKERNKKRPREGCKLALIVTLLEREGGVTLNELCGATEWQQHTIRGAFAGALKKRFGFSITSTKEGKQVRRYRIESRNDSVG